MIPVSARCFRWSSSTACWLDGSPAGRIGERGTAVSVGERQRIGIARALYDDREILVMDEATAALDSDTEDLLGSAIDALLGQYTVLVIAHRIATVGAADALSYWTVGAWWTSGPTMPC